MKKITVLTSSDLACVGGLHMPKSTLIISANERILSDSIVLDIDDDTLVIEYDDYRELHIGYLRGYGYELEEYEITIPA